jgi:[ribosomal protein S5]-alanine N-acetyltransferase
MTPLAGLELQTERLTLKVLDPSFADRVLDYVIRNRAFFKEWSPAVDETFYTPAFQHERLQRDIELLDNGSALRLWIFKKEDLTFQRVIGDFAFSNIIRGAFQSCHLGYKIDELELNSGFMTEALRRGIDLAFDDLALHRIEANIMPRNKRSIRVVEKLGFVNEGLSRKYLKINGAWEDHLHYVLLNDDLEG